MPTEQEIQAAEEQQIRELLKPRIKVVADFWDNPFQVGQIISFEKLVRSGEWCYKYAEHDGINTKLLSDFTEYPHLFQPLPWYAERTEQELKIVKYVGYTAMEGATEKIFEVEKHKRNSFGAFNSMGYIAGGTFHSYSKSRIATETEYKAYINQIK